VRSGESCHVLISIAIRSAIQKYAAGISVAAIQVRGVRIR